jgi:RNA-binding protein
LLKLWKTDADTIKREEGKSQTMSNLTTGMKRRIKRKLSEEKPTIMIGKNQVSREILKEVEKQLEQKEVVKIKILKSALQDNKAKEMASRIAEDTEATLVEVRGHTLILYKRRGKNREK